MEIKTIKNYIDEILMDAESLKYPGRTISEIYYQNGKIERFYFGWK